LIIATIENDMDAMKRIDRNGWHEFIRWTISGQRNRVGKTQSVSNRPIDGIVGRRSKQDVGVTTLPVGPYDVYLIVASFQAVGSNTGKPVDADLPARWTHRGNTERCVVEDRSRRANETGGVTLALNDFDIATPLPGNIDSAPFIDSCGRGSARGRGYLLSNNAGH
jgi:hypothetical protein